MAFSLSELQRYSRQMMLDEIGADGQMKLKQARVLVIGAGGLGCPVLQYLAAAGVGHIGIVDGDHVELSNLQRQILYTIEDIGHQKVNVAKRRLQQLNPHVCVEIYPYALNAMHAGELFQQYDIVVDGTDNFKTRYLVNDCCVAYNKPLVFGSIYRFEGQVSVLNYKGGPSYRCIFPEPPEEGQVPDCATVGVVPSLPGIIGAMQANEVIKIITGAGDVLSGKLMVANMLTFEFNVFDFNKTGEVPETIVLSKAV